MLEQKSLPHWLTNCLLLCGIAAAGIYVLTDVAAAASYPGFSYADQAVSELFAIGAPTSHFVVPLFSLSSALLLIFGVGIAANSKLNRSLRIAGTMFVASALDALLLWNFFPMHMRGEEQTYTDTMHLALATNPFVLAALVAAMVAFRGWFRSASIAVLATVLALALFGFHYASAITGEQPTPGLGTSERAAQYLYQAWQIALAVLLIRSSEPSRLTAAERT